MKNLKNCVRCEKRGKATFMGYYGYKAFYKCIDVGSGNSPRLKATQYSSNKGAEKLPVTFMREIRDLLYLLNLSDS